MDSISLLGSSPASTKVCFLPNGLMNGSKEGSGKPTVAIIGSGDFSKSLTLRLLRSGFHVVVGSRQPKRAAESFPHVVDVTHHEDAVGKANIVFLAIRREHYSSLWDIKHLLAGKILVDVSNNRRVNQYPESNAEYLASLFAESIVVKGFNVISSWAMQSGPRDSSRQVHSTQFSVLLQPQDSGKSKGFKHAEPNNLTQQAWPIKTHSSTCFCSDLLAELKNSVQGVSEPRHSVSTWTHSQSI